MADASYGSLPFSEQIAFLRAKVNLPTHSWTDILNEAHDHAFVVAGANRADLVADFRAAVDKAISQGTSLATFRKDFDAIVARYGWDYNGGRNWRSRVIYETNLRTSYAAGRYAQLQRVKTVRPYWRYRHADGEKHPRPLHESWDGLVLHADDPWWQAHFPPGGWGCQCTVDALNARDLARMGKSGPDTAPDDGTETHTVGVRGPSPRTVETPAGIDPGFGYTPGRDAWLREHVARDVATAGAQATASWDDVLGTTWRDLGRPDRIPLAPAPVPLGPRFPDARATTQALKDLLGGDNRVFDVHDLPIALDADVIGPHLDPARSPYLPLLIDLLSDPFEVWVDMERAADTGIHRVRARLIKGYQLKHGRIVLLVADQRDGSFVGWTAFATGDRKYINRQRRGLLWWGAE